MSDLYQSVTKIHSEDYYCALLKCGAFEDSIDELLQKYCYSMPAGKYDYWD